LPLLALGVTFAYFLMAFFFPMIERRVRAMPGPSNPEMESKHD